VIDSNGRELWLFRVGQVENDCPNKRKAAAGLPHSKRSYLQK
jgi:hypothetical protein